MNNNIVFLGLLMLLAYNGTINATQTFIMLALLSSTYSDECNCSENSDERNSRERSGFRNKCTMN